MHAGSHYSFREFLLWTRREIFIFLLLAVVPTLLYQYWDWHWLAIPWVPVTLIGTAAAFIVGFKNTQTYNRLWEARQIWGSIVNTARAWGIMVKDCVIVPDNAAEAKDIHRQLIYRHVAWLTALRFQLRESRAWENMGKSYNKEYSRLYTIPEREQKLDEELKKYLSAPELAYVLSKKNRATHIVSLQSKQLRELKQQGYIDPLNYIELENLLVNFYEQQGKCERIKNFPYPRQFASINLFFVRLFVFMVPFGMLKEFEKLGEHMVWMTIPFSVLVSWVFSSMEKVGESTENPFEGGSNDVPITSMSRTIEIDLREMLDETDLPPAIQAVHNILM
jgi:ion channel-forming bestrophin family protein